ncbi:MAG: hypothetical protein ACJAVY_000629 [Marinoscillum sp.]|jgi:hypothetical protein
MIAKAKEAEEEESRKRLGCFLFIAIATDE